MRHPNTVPSLGTVTVVELAVNYLDEAAIVIEVAHGNTGHVVAMPPSEARKLRDLLIGLDLGSAK
jgi:hypothetical protein